MQKISIIIPIYKVEQYLCQCLESIVNQTYQNLEIILIDDGSPDRCGAICDEYAKKDSRIIVVHKENEGLCAARNDGLRKATGEWVTFVDSDDWCERDYYQGFLNALGDRRVDVLCASGYIREENGRSKMIPLAIDWTKVNDNIEPKHLLSAVLCSKSVSDRRKGANLGFPWDKMYRTEFLKDCHLMYDDSLKSWEDLFFNFQIFNKAKSIMGCDCVGYHYRQVATSIAHGFNPNKPAVNYNFISKLYDYIERYNMDEDVLAAAAAVTMSTIKNSLDCCYYHSDNKKARDQVGKEIREMTIWPHYYDVLHSNLNWYMTPNQIMLKHVLRNICGGGLLRILYMARQILH